MSHQDIREWLAGLERDGELKRISGADCDLEMSGICEILLRESKQAPPAIIYENIPGYPKGFRTAFSLLSSPRRLARALYLPEDRLKPLELVQSWRQRMKGFKPLPPLFVESSTAIENTLTGGDVDLNMFPVPRFHEMDGGRYIGTAHAVIMQDPDTGWVNLGVYRCMLIDRNRIALHILEGQHGSTVLNDSYFARGKTMPVAIAIGMDVTLWFASAHQVPWQMSEYDYAGGVKGEPIEVIRGPHTGLPLPAFAEILIEGECHPGDLAGEGPFGEWNGYYANLGLSSVPEPVIRVTAVHYRNDPILTCCTPAVPPSELTMLSCFRRSAAIWDRLERSSVPGIRGVWCYAEGGGSLFNVVSLQQAYAGHAREAGLVASQATGNHGRFTVVVDEDIDPSDLSQVMWAVATRVDPEHGIQVLQRQRTTSADITISPEEKRKLKVPKPLHCSRAVIDACRPFEWKAEWYPVARMSTELRDRLVKKWAQVFEGPA